MCSSALGLRWPEPTLPDHSPVQCCWPQPRRSFGPHVASVGCATLPPPLPTPSYLFILLFICSCVPGTWGLGLGLLATSTRCKQSSVLSKVRVACIVSPRLAGRGLAATRDVLRGCDPAYRASVPRLSIGNPPLPICLVLGKLQQVQSLVLLYEVGTKEYSKCLRFFY